LLEMLRGQPRTLHDMGRISGVGARKLERYGQAFLDVLADAPAALEPVADVRHEVITLVRAGMTPPQISRQLSCSEKNVYSILAEAIARQQLSLEQALELPDDLVGEIQDAFLEEEGDLPPAAALADRFADQVPVGVLYCIRAALAAELAE